MSDVCGHRMRNIRIRLLNLGFWVAAILKESFTSNHKPFTVTKDFSFDEIRIVEKLMLTRNIIHCVSTAQ